MPPTTIDRTQITAVCELLGLDPAKVSEIRIDQHGVTVSTRHPVTDPMEDEI